MGRGWCRPGAKSERAGSRWKRFGRTQHTSPQRERGLAVIPRWRFGLGCDSVLAVLVSRFVWCRIDHVGEAVVIAILEIFQIETVCVAHVGQRKGDDLFTADVLDR